MSSLHFGFTGEIVSLVIEGTGEAHGIGVPSSSLQIVFEGAALAGAEGEVGVGALAAGVSV